MKQRKEYEEILKNTFTTNGDAQATRIEIDLLLDIRDILVWFKEDKMLKEIVEEREKAEYSRVRSITNN